ncbi:iron uptake system protein EfeO [Dongia soli]|uniref:Iron uptake system protein EfeO n=1 Tax=Dongia soli TaxID=600628 RepID=A0ABU5E9E7_9PROT|nr:iron uptake system protein EfeO [Dongia soli]MDY0882902.1 iron uptake system protein EfeO [Dongia soli]
MSRSHASTYLIGAIVAVAVVGVFGIYAVASVKKSRDLQTTNPTQSASQEQDAVTVAVTVTGKACEPNALTVPAGKTTFLIVNKSSRALEWEILNGVMVVDERENIAPGFMQKLTTTLAPGSYDITCGLLSNPKGKLTVTTTGAQPTQKPSAVDLIGPIAEYNVYVISETDDLAADTKKFTDAVRGNRLQEAQSLYAPARMHYERIEPIAELFSDLDASIDSRADDHEKKEQDPNFTGFHRLEYGLFSRKSTVGLNAFADQLDADTQELQKRIADLTIPPEKLVDGAAALIEEVASSKISGEEDRYSGTDLWDFQANVEGAEKIVDLLRPLTQKADRALSERIDGNFKAVEQILAKYKAATGGYLNYDKLTKEDRTTLQGPITALAEDLSKLHGTLGLN